VPPHWTRVKALRVNAGMTSVQGDRARAMTLLAAARALADVLGESVEDSYIPLMYGSIHMFAGDYAAALPVFAEALAGFRRRHRRGGEMWALTSLGLTRGLAGRPGDGFADLLACIQLATEHGEVWWRSFALWALSVLRWRDGDLTGATATAKETLQIRDMVEDEQFGAALAIETLAWIAGSEGRDERAALMLGASERMWRAMRTSLSVFGNLYEFHDHTVTRVRGRMGDASFESALRRGADLSPAEVLEQALERQAKPGASGQRSGDTLTPREREVAKLVAEGLSNREIAARLVVAQRTAEGHVENILSKLGFTSRAQVAAWMAGQGASRPG
jgi:DNA-binding CsgD family transcriptional regulator